MTGPEGRDVPPFRFRPAAEADFERLLDLSIRTMRPQLEAIGRWDPARRRARMREGFDPAATRCIEAPDGRLLGCVSVFAGDEVTEVSGFYLEPDCQGAGLGRAVMRAILAEHLDRPARVEVLKGSRAMDFYRRLGFALVAEQEFDWLLERPPGG
ncbi:GNAT family N-acetyltransferase [Pseudoroseomonas cervicalis]|uniref:Acetyltransferase, GNAT family n=1 Tax=Pseudoroseomonas cervicalis ATCC 49957 TaxID=525371 RepID=D5RIL9_9PROT|nr:GNAT family N-acetyltransferase [Pseudoroseomonas cervicalis]EFH12848.1 acetyltransferase, GNAT family [Pseudoroseomonas cervicalis ATCC 49957]